MQKNSTKTLLFSLVVIKLIYSEKKSQNQEENK